MGNAGESGAIQATQAVTSTCEGRIVSEVMSKITRNRASSRSYRRPVRDAMRAMGAKAEAVARMATIAMMANITN